MRACTGGLAGRNEIRMCGRAASSGLNPLAPHLGLFPNAGNDENSLAKV